MCVVYNSPAIKCISEDWAISNSSSFVRNLQTRPSHPSVHVYTTGRLSFCSLRCDHIIIMLPTMLWRIEFDRPTVRTVDSRHHLLPNIKDINDRHSNVVPYTRSVHACGPYIVYVIHPDVVKQATLSRYSLSVGVTPSFSISLS